jgi:NAD(P)-dependent dehydrogenase (short-subunit alcohol dehydrogenase family)
MKIGTLFDVTGLATIVTGGGSGIGFACAEAMADNGARVTIMDLDPARLAAAVTRLRDAGGDVRGAVADVTDRAGLNRAFDEAAAHYGRLDVVFANAGIGGGPGFLALDGERNPAGAIEAIAEAVWDRVLAMDLTSVFTTIRAAARHMKPRNAGRIIVTTSISATKTELHVGTPYVAAKAGSAQLVRQAAHELAGYNILVNAIAPGPVVTNISGGRLQDPEIQTSFARLSPMHRMGATDDIQGIALFLASPASRFVTGAEIIVDGGYSLGAAD